MLEDKLSEAKFQKLESLLTDGILSSLATHYPLGMMHLKKKKVSEAHQEFQLLLTDYHKNIWAAEAESLIEECDFKNIPLKGAGKINAISADEKYLWLATDKGLVRFNKENESYEIFTTKDGLISDDVRDVVVNGDYVWITTYYGINRYRKSTKEIEIMKKGVFFDSMLDGENFWCISWEGMAIYNTKSGEWKSYSEGGGAIESSEDSIWFVKTHGIERYDKRRDAWRRFSKRDISGPDFRTAGCLDSIVIDEGCVWIGSGKRGSIGSGAGLFRYDRSTEAWERITSGFANVLVSDERYLWAARFISGQGWVNHRYEKITGDWKKLDAVVYSAAIDGDYIWFGGEGSIIRYKKVLLPNELSNTIKLQTDGKYSDAIFIYQKFLRKYPASIWTDEVRYRIGMCFLKLQKYQRAITSFQRVLKENLKSRFADDAQYQIAVCYEFLMPTSPEYAVREYKRLVELYPQSKFAEGAKYRVIERYCKAKMYKEAIEEFAKLPLKDDVLMRECRLKEKGEIVFTKKDGLWENQIEAIEIDKDNVWVIAKKPTPRCIEDRGVLCQYNKTSKEWKFHTIEPLRYIDSFLLDKDYLWVRKGWCFSIYLEKYNKGSNLWTTILEPKNRLFLEFAIDKDSLWIATDDEGLIKYNKETGLFTSILKNNEESIIDLIKVGKDNIWVVTYGGLRKYDKNTNAKEIFTSVNLTNKRERIELSGDYRRIFHSISEEKRFAWFAIDKMLLRYNKKTQEWCGYDIPGTDSVKEVVFDKDFIWVIREIGVSRFSKDGCLWQTFTTRDGLASNIITTIAPDEDYVWIGSERGGITKYRKAKDTFSVYSAPDGDEMDTITVIKVDEDAIWFGTKGSGIRVVNKEKLKNKNAK